MNCFGLPPTLAAQTGPFLRHLPCTSGGEFRHVPGLLVLGNVWFEPNFLTDEPVYSRGATPRAVKGTQVSLRCNPGSHP